MTEQNQVTTEGFQGQEGPGLGLLQQLSPGVQDQHWLLLDPLSSQIPARGL